MEFWVVAIGFAFVYLARLVGQTWFIRRWIADGMSPTRAALLSIAVTQLPLIAGFTALVWLADSGMTLGDVALLIGLLLLPSLFWFGLRRAVFEYMDQYGVKGDLKRRQK